MADYVECPNEACSEYGVKKYSLGGEIDETIPAFCGTCGTQVAGPVPPDPDQGPPAIDNELPAPDE